MAEQFTQSVLDELESAIGPEGLARVLAAFLDELSGMKQQISEFDDSSDCEIVSRCAHTLKSISGTFGATQLQVVSKYLEEAASQKQAEAIARHRNSILGLIDEAIAHYKSLQSG